MKYYAVCLLISCASLISAERDFFDKGTKSNLFAPLSEAVRPILFKGITKYSYEKMKETLDLNWEDRRNLLLKVLHSDKTDKYPINLHANVVKSESIAGSFNYKLQETIDFSTDVEKLFKLGLKFFEEIHKVKNFSLLEGDDKYLWLKYSDIILDELTLRFKYEDLASFGYDGHYDIMYNISKANICNRKQSSQQAITDFYGHVLLIGAQIYMNTYFAEGIALKSYAEEKKDYFDEFHVRYLVEDFENNMLNYHKQMLDFINTVSSEIWVCDPQYHVEDVTYTKLDRPFKDYSKDEKDFKCHISYTSACHNLKETTDRYFSIRPVLANVEENKVITGVRIVKKEHIIHIQIQEGELLGNGSINEKSVSWTPLLSTANDAYDIKSSKFKGIDLSGIFKDSQNVLSGISFDKVEAHDGEYLRLVTYTTPFNFKTGKLDVNLTERPGREMQEIEQPKQTRTQLKYKDDKLPIDSEKENVPNSNTQAYIMFNTIKSGKGAGQTVPFIDIQPVETYPPTLMSGAGLYYKGNDESGGFLGLKLFTYNIVPFMDTYNKNYKKTN